MSSGQRRRKIGTVFMWQQANKKNRAIKRGFNYQIKKFKR
jgi:hypothetical protein